MNMDSRLRRLEERIGEGGCPECSGSAGIVVAYDAAASREPLDHRCPRCRRALTIIRVVYDGGEEEGGGY